MDVQHAMVSLFCLTAGMYQLDFREIRYEPSLLIAVIFFVAVSTILLMNLLIAQLNCSYNAIYQDTLGFARLNRARVVVDTVPVVPAAKWNKFVKGLRMDQQLDFDEGDVGLSG